MITAQSGICRHLNHRPDESPARTCVAPISLHGHRKLGRKEVRAVLIARSTSVVHVGAEVQPGLTGVPVAVPDTPFVDANEQTIRNTDPNRVGLGDFTRNDGGPPRFMCSFVPGSAPIVPRSDLPFLLYLPGIDGTGLAASKQFPALSTYFDFAAFSVPPHDRTWFPGLIEQIELFLEEQVAGFPPERPVYLLGESFGGILALAVAANRPDLVDRVVLVNPATSYQQSIWPTLGPLLPRVPKELYEAVPIALAPVLGNPLSLASAGVDRSLPLQDQAAGFAQGLLNLLPQLSALADILPPPTLEWKLRLLDEGCRYMANRYVDVQQRVLLLIGDADLLIPSKDEGTRLEKTLPRCVLKVLEGRSHALMQETGFDLIAELQSEGFYTTRRNMTTPIKTRSRNSFGTASPIELPTPREFDLLADRSLGWLRRLTSPVFFSRDERGNLQRGLAGIPTDRPILFVGNHQTYALDIGLLIEAILKQTGLLPRGLAHPIIFAGADTGISNFLQTYGAVKVGPTSYFRLLRSGESVLLFPGGVREAYKNKNEEYQLFWPDSPEFVRTAARFGATIVPLAAVGCEDSVQMLLDKPDILKLPFVGDRIMQSISEIPQARRGAMVDNMESEQFVAPFSVPKPPERFYFTFGSPIQTRKEDARDPQRAKQLYTQTKNALESEIATLLRLRTDDPYRMLPLRLLYETLNRGAQAPTFPLPPLL